MSNLEKLFADIHKEVDPLIKAHRESRSLSTLRNYSGRHPEHMDNIRRNNRKYYQKTKGKQ